MFRAELHCYEAHGISRKKSNVGIILISFIEVTRMSTSKFAICIDNSEYPASLELHKIYRVIPDDDAERNGNLL